MPGYLTNTTLMYEVLPLLAGGTWFACNRGHRSNLDSMALSQHEDQCSLRGRRHDG